MCIYCGTKNYRKIYESHFGSILKEPNGRSYEIHHIDGNHNNNSPDNLQMVTIQDHYNIHYTQGDWAACLRMSSRMQVSNSEKSMIARNSVQTRILNGTWHFTSNFAKQHSNRRVLEGTHHWQTKEHAEHVSERHRQKVKDGTHSLLGGNNPVHKRILNGTHHTLGPYHNLTMLAAGKHVSQKHTTCPHCNTRMDNANYAKHHGDNCSLVKDKVPLSQNPNYVNSRALLWKITNLITGEVNIIIGLNTWAKSNNFNTSTVNWAVGKHGKFKHYLIQKVN